MDRRAAIGVVLVSALGGLPNQRPDQLTFPPEGGQEIPGSRIGRFPLVVIFGPKASLLVYSGPPASGNLVASIAPVSGHDNKGNAFTGGVASYNPGTLTGARINGGTFAFLTAASVAGPWVVGSQMFDTAGNTLNLLANLEILAQALIVAQQGIHITGSGLSVVGGIAADIETIISSQPAGPMLDITNQASPTAPNVRINCNAAGDNGYGLRVTGDTNSRCAIDTSATTTRGRLRAGPGNAALDCSFLSTAVAQWASDPIAFNNAGAAEVWQVVGGNGATFAGTWANAAAPGVNLKYRRNAAPYLSSHWVGRITNTVAQVANSAITAAVPAAYRPTNTHDITCFNITTGAVVRVSIGSAGILTCQSAIAANDIVGIPDTSIGLDA